jgi:hypothetical protein
MIAKFLWPSARPEPHRLWFVTVQGGSSSGIVVAQQNIG